MAYVKINSEGCKGCQLCMDFCPRGALAAGDGINRRGVHPTAQVDPSRCNGCRICAMMCPDVCIDVYKDAPMPGKDE